MAERLMNLRAEDIDNSVRDLLRKALNRIKIDVANNMKNHGRTASGKSVRSLQVSIRQTNHSFFGTLEGSKSFLYMQRGRGPGGIPVGFTAIIERWLAQKGIALYLPEGKKPRKDLVRARRDIAGAIARTIMNEGTLLHRERLFDDIIDSAVKTNVALLKKQIPQAYKNVIEESFVQKK